MVLFKLIETSKDQEVALNLANFENEVAKIESKEKFSPSLQRMDRVSTTNFYNGKIAFAILAIIIIWALVIIIFNVFAPQV